MPMLRARTRPLRPPQHARAPKALTSALLALAAAAPAHADRPLTSETADVIGANDCQVEFAASLARRSGSANGNGQDVFASCGTRWNTQFGLQAARARQEGSQADSLGLLGKTTLVMPEDERVGLGVAYGVTGGRAAGEGWKHGSTRVTGVATRKLARQLLGHLNLGWLRTESDRLNNTVWSLGMESEGGPWGWAADVYGDDRSRPWFSAGVLLELGDGVSVNLSQALQFSAPRVRQWTLGGKIKF